MLKSIEVISKTKEEAVNKALAELKATIDEVEIEVIEEGARGFLGIGSKPFKIKVSKKSDPVKVAKDFLREIFVSIGVSVTVNCELIDEKYLNIDLVGDNMGVIIGKRGQTLDSLQYLTSIVVNKKEGSFVNVSIDTENYRKKRKETLESLAVGLAKKAKHLRKDVVLEPMNPSERRVIHATLQNDRYVTTHSEGEGAFRYVVISPKDTVYSSYGTSSYKSGYKDIKEKDSGNYRGSYKGGYKSSYKGGYNKEYSYKESYKSDSYNLDSENYNAE